MHGFGEVLMKVVQIVISDLTKTSKVTCPYCGKSKYIPNAQLRLLSHALQAKCTCSQAFQIMVNRRGFPRKKVQFEGELFLPGAQERAARVDIRSISVGGIGFMAEGASLQVGDVFTLAFHLDDEFNTEVREEIEVSHIHGEAIGAKFTGPNAYNPDLDFYLMPFDPDLDA